MNRLLITLLMIASAAAAQPTDGGAPSAKTLNDEGYELYKAGKWQQAAERFKEAFTADPNLAIAHYNFAATTYRHQQLDSCAELKYPLSEAVEHLATSLRLDKRRVRRLAKDPDFEEFRQTARYYALLGADLHSVAGLAAVLPKLKIRAPTLADSGPFFRLQFNPGGKVDVFEHHLEDSGWTWVKRTGTWRLKRSVADGGGSVIVLELKAPATRDSRELSNAGPIEVGPTELILKGGNMGPYFASDEWVDCCC